MNNTITEMIQEPQSQSAQSAEPVVVDPETQKQVEKLKAEYIALKPEWQRLSDELNENRKYEDAYIHDPDAVIISENLWILSDSIDIIKSDITEKKKQIEINKQNEIELQNQQEYESKLNRLQELGNEAVAILRYDDRVPFYYEGKDGIPPIPHNLSNEPWDDYTIDERIKNAEDILQWMQNLEQHLKDGK